MYKNGFLKDKIDCLTEELVKQALLVNGWNKSKVCESLGISRNSLNNLIYKYELREESFIEKKVDYVNEKNRPPKKFQIKCKKKIYIYFPGNIENFKSSLFKDYYEFVGKEESLELICSGSKSTNILFFSNLVIEENFSLKTLEANVSIYGDLIIKDCLELLAISRNLKCLGRAIISNCPKLYFIPEVFYNYGGLELRGSHNINLQDFRVKRLMNYQNYYFDITFGESPWDDEDQYFWDAFYSTDKISQCDYLTDDQLTGNTSTLIEKSIVEYDFFYKRRLLFYLYIKSEGKINKVSEIWEVPIEDVFKLYKIFDLKDLIDPAWYCSNQLQMALDSIGIEKVPWEFDEMIKGTFF